MIGDLELALLAIFVVLAVNMGLTLRLYSKLVREPETARRSENQVQAAMDNAAAEANDEDGGRKDAFDEGFENLMRYTVNGRTGCEGNG